MTVYNETKREYNKDRRNTEENKSEEDCKEM